MRLSLKGAQLPGIVPRTLLEAIGLEKRQLLNGRSGMFFIVLWSHRRDKGLQIRQ